MKAGIRFGMVTHSRWHIGIFFLISPKAHKAKSLLFCCDLRFISNTDIHSSPWCLALWCSKYCIGKFSGFKAHKGDEYPLLT